MANGVRWHQRQKDEWLGLNCHQLKAPPVWTWAWEKEKLKELRRRITPSPKDYSTSKQCSRRRTLTVIGASTCSSNAKLEKCHRARSSPYSARAAWEATQQVVTVCRPWVQMVKLLMKINNKKWWKGSQIKWTAMTLSTSRSKMSNKSPIKNKWSWRSRHRSNRIKSHQL